MSVTAKFSPTEDSERSNFERALHNAATKGELPPSESGITFEVEKLIIEVAQRFPDTKELEAKARKAFEAQL